MPVRRFLGSALVLAVLCAVGCDDPKQRIAMLEDENRNLNQEMDNLRRQVQSANRDLQNCQGRLASLQTEADGLRGQLAQPVDLPGNWQAVNGGAMIAIEGSVLFPAGRAELKGSGGKVLDRLASEIKSSFSDKDIYVFGHTDSDPIKKSGWEDNRELSSERALAVVRKLQALGVPGKHLASCGWGEHRPVASNASTDGKAKNRRVEIFAVDPSLASR